MCTIHVKENILDLWASGGHGGVEERKPAKMRALCCCGSPAPRALLITASLDADAHIWVIYGFEL